MTVAAFSLKAQQSRYDGFKNLDAAFLPDENITYFAEKIELLTESENEDVISFIGIKAKMRGNHIDFLVKVEPSLKPIVKGNKHRKDVNPLPGDNFVTCVRGGTICIILLKKNQY